jgi:hypothetical protein
VMACSRGSGELFGQRSTRAVRFVMSSAFRQLGTPAG